VSVVGVCRLNVDGLRGDIVTNRAAKALVAYEGRNKVTQEDVEKVVTLCLNHRCGHGCAAKPFGVQQSVSATARAHACQPWVQLCGRRNGAVECRGTSTALLDGQATFVRLQAAPVMGGLGVGVKPEPVHTQHVGSKDTNAQGVQKPGPGPSLGLKD